MLHSDAWTETHLKKLDLRARNLLRGKKMHRLGASSETLHLPYGKGGRNFPSAELIWAKTRDLKEDFDRRLANPLQPPTRETTNYDSMINKMIHERDMRIRQGSYYTNLKMHQSEVDTWKSLSAINEADFTMAREAKAYQVREDAIPLRGYISPDSKVEAESAQLCRMCMQQKETTLHVLSKCRLLTSSCYTLRHDDVCRVIHLGIAKKYGLIEKETKTWTHAPLPIMMKDGIKLEWNRKQPFATQSNAIRPDILLVTPKMVEVIEISVPSEENIGKAHQQKLNKYQELVQRLAKTYCRTCKIRVVIVGSKGSLHKTTSNILSNLGVDIGQVQKIILNWGIKITDLVLAT